MESSADSSVYSASGTPLGMIEDRDKKKFLKVIYYILLIILQNELKG
jgi:hypothetical protein